MRRLVILAFLTPVLAAATTLDFTLAGNQVGTNTFVIAADGTFKSVTALSVGPTKIASTFTGVLKEGRITEFVLEETAGPASGKIVWKGGKVTVTSSGKVVRDAIAFEPKTKAFFTTYHPQAIRTFLAAYPTGGKVMMLDLNSLAEMPVEMKLEPATVELKSGATPIRRVRFSLGGLEIVYAAQATEPNVIGMQVAAQSFIGVARGFEGVFVDPLSKYPELSQPTHKTIRETRVRATMRDGQRMMADIVRPIGEGKHPVILVRTPYGRATQILMMGEMYASRGYAVVVQDVRGTGGSDGRFDPFNVDVADGKDTLDWLTEQPWCDGNVGMIGGSYLGMVQWAAAVNHHPALKAIVPQVSPPEPVKNVPWDHGVFLLAGGAWWARIVKDRQANMAMASMGFKNLKPLLSMPLSKVDDTLFGENVPFFDLWLSRPFASDWKGSFTTAQVATVKIPVLHVSGVWDGDGIGTKLHWEALRKNGGNQWMIFGPWEHGFNVKTKFGDQDYGAGSVLELESVYLRFFDTFLKQKEAKWGEQPRVRFFETGSNKWLQGSDWPLPEAKPLTLYLAGGRATGHTGKGSLAAAPGPAGRDQYRYDPNKPAAKDTPIEVDSSKSKLTQSPAASKHNMLVYRTAPFTSTTRLSGPFTADLFVSTSVRDASFHVILFDEDTKGNWTVLGLPGQRRIGWTKDGRFGPVKPNEVRRIEVAPWEFAREFKPGHRLVVTIQSDLFPGFARNPGTGEPDLTATKMLAATHTVHKGGKMPSKVTLYRLGSD